jgi:hypothetical protein
MVSRLLVYFYGYAKGNIMTETTTEKPTDARLFDIREYATEEGDPALSLQLHISHMVTQDAHPFDTGLRRDAMKHAGRLANAFEDLGREIQYRRDLVTGSRLDPRKRRWVGVGLRQGYLDLNEVRPYMRLDYQRSLPRIHIIASAGNVELHEDPAYVGRVARLALPVAWACESAGLEVHASLNAGYMRSRLNRQQKYRDAQIVYTLMETGRFTPLNHYGMTQDRDTFLWSGFPHAYAQDSHARRAFADLQGKRSVRWGYAYLSANGGRGVHWARVQGAELVIAIGNFGDGHLADIHLPNNFDVPQAVESIERAVRGMV